MTPTTARGNDERLPLAIASGWPQRSPLPRVACEPPGGRVAVAVVVRRAAGSELALDAGGCLLGGLQLGIERHPGALDDQSVAIGPDVTDLAGRAVVQLGAEGTEDARGAEVGSDAGAVEPAVTQIGGGLDDHCAPASGQEHDVSVRVASARRERHLDLAVTVGEAGGVGREPVRGLVVPSPRTAARGRQSNGRERRRRPGTTTVPIDHDSAR
jgi:hypothetical protein